MEKSKGVCNDTYPTETSKIRGRILKYLNGTILDVGCGREKVVPNAIGVDIADYRSVNVQLKDETSIYELDEIIPDKVDAVFSSHFLEHCRSWSLALLAMVRCLKDGGALILYLPDDRYYDNDSNPSHLHRFTYDGFLKDLESFPLEILESGEDVDLPNRYSFYIVGRKK